MDKHRLDAKWVVAANWPSERRRHSHAPQVSAGGETLDRKSVRIAQKPPDRLSWRYSDEFWTGRRRMGSSGGTRGGRRVRSSPGNILWLIDSNNIISKK